MIVGTFRIKTLNKAKSTRYQIVLPDGSTLWIDGSFEIVRNEEPIDTPQS